MNYDEFWELQIERIWRDYLDKYFEKLRGKSRLSMVISNPSIEISLDHYDPWISGFLTEYMFKEIKLTSSTARLQIGGIFDRWIATGKPFDWLVDQLVATNLFDKTRARRIAMTESTRIYAENNLAVWRQSEIVNKKRWYTAVDEKVCPICGALDGKEVGLDEEFAPGILAPPAHVNCRCIIRPVVSETLQEIKKQKKLDHWEQLLEENPHLNPQYWNEKSIKSPFARNKDVSSKELLSWKEYDVLVQALQKVRPKLEDISLAAEVKDFVSKELAKLAQKWGIPVDYYHFASSLSAWAETSNNHFISALMQKVASQVFDSKFNLFQQKLYDRFWGKKGFNVFYDQLKQAMREKFMTALPPKFGGLSEKDYRFLVEYLAHNSFRSFTLPAIPELGIDEEEMHLFLLRYGVPQKLIEIGLSIPLDKYNTSELWTAEFMRQFEDWVQNWLKYMPQIIEVMYENTQNTLREALKQDPRLKNVKYLKLYRGVVLNLPEKDLPIEHSFIDYTMGNAIESWSLNMATSASFGDVIFSANVPISRIIGSAYTGLGCLGEYEFVVNGTGIDKVFVERSPRKYSGKSFAPSLDSYCWGMLPDGKYVFLDPITNGDWIKKSGKSVKEVNEWAKWYTEQNAEA
jgi:SPP1 gp7 family putative phage head morphogenesis protein